MFSYFSCDSFLFCDCKDTHGARGPDNRKAVGGPINSTAQQTVQKHPKHGCGAMSIQDKSADDERWVLQDDPRGRPMQKC